MPPISYLFSIFLILISAFQLHASGLPKIDPARVAEIKGWLCAPADDGLGPTIDDRDFWHALANIPVGREILEEAARARTQPVPELTAEMYADFHLTGRRAPYERPFGRRISRLGAFLYAELLTDEGEYLPLIERELAAILDEPTWAVPSHSQRRTQNGKLDWHAARTNVDLAAANRVWSLATTDRLLGERLHPATRARIRDEAHDRVFAPYLERVRSGQKQDFWWMNVSNNWNPVCNAGVLGAALILVESDEDRALFAAAFEALSTIYLASYADDGFCEEGIGYWSYGFGHFLLGAETLRIATGGELDLLAAPKVKNIAAFGSRWQLPGSIYAAFGDNLILQQPSPWIGNFAAIRYGQGKVTRDIPFFQKYPHPFGEQLYRILFTLAQLPAQNTNTEPSLGQAPDNSLSLRDWFPQGGALVLRGQPADEGLAIAIKGGHNGQSHNHNDLGSFVVVNNGKLVLTDLGSDSYVRDTFSDKRYTSGVMNSFGHPVPRVAGQLQRTGAEARAVTQSTSFSDDSDTWIMDLTSAYAVPALESLTRTFIFERSDSGRLQVIDHVRFTTAQAFDTALVLQLGQTIESSGPSSFRVHRKNSAETLTVTYAAEGSTLKLVQEPIHGIVPGSPARGTRIGLDFEEPVLEATIRITITP